MEVELSFWGTRCKIIGCQFRISLICRLIPSLFLSFFLFIILLKLSLSLDFSLSHSILSISYCSTCQCRIMSFRYKTPCFSIPIMIWKLDFIFNRSAFLFTSFCPLKLSHTIFTLSINHLKWPSDWKFTQCINRVKDLNLI